MTQKRTLFFSVLLGGSACFASVACSLAPNPDLPYTDSGKGDGTTDNGDGGLAPGEDGNSGAGGSGATDGHGGAGGEGGTNDED